MIPSLENLLAGVYRIVDRHQDMAARRQATLELLAELLDADNVHWSWGSGDAEGKVDSPLGIIMIGYDWTASRVKRSPPN